MGRSAALIERAKSATSLEDFGDPSFHEGLERLLSSVDSEARLNERGNAIIEFMILGMLTARLEIENWYARHPEIDDQEIVAPLIGLGLPRTGSTALSCMLAEDPGVRSIRAWETLSPTPPPETATEHTDPRIAEQAARMAFSDQLSPRFKTMLPVSPTAPMECQQYMAYDFKSGVFQATGRVPSYTKWLYHEADLVPTYQYVKRVLKLLQWRCPPNRWRLKNPNHMLWIDALDKVFPDARYYMTHRDITKVIPSVVDLYQELMKHNTDQLDFGYIAEVNTGWIELGLNRVMDFRKRGANSRFIDIEFGAFQADPMAHIERLYAFIGEELTDEARRRMLAWREANPADKHGKREYIQESLDIDLVALAARFSFYDHKMGGGVREHA